jgi:hypothetical protein
MVKSDKTALAPSPRTSAKVPAPKPKPSDREAKTTAQLKARYDALPARGKAKVSALEGGGISIVADGCERLHAVQTFTAFGTTSLPFVNQTLGQISKVVARNRPLTSDEYNSAVALLSAVEPENEVEALLGANIFIANHMAAKCMAMGDACEFTDQMQDFHKLAVKYMRTFTMNVEALAKLRRKGEQVVRHVHVHEGGQAVVAGTINQGGTAKDGE